MPLYHFDIDAEVSPSDAIKRVQSIVCKYSFVESLKFWRFFDPKRKPFVGKVDDDSFSIRRDIWYNNSFLPRIHGQVEATLGGSKVSITMSLHPFTMAVFCLFVAMTVFSMARTYLIVRSIPPFDFLFIGFSVAIFLIGFIPEAIKAKKLLIEAIQAPAHQPIVVQKSF